MAKKNPDDGRPDELVRAMHEAKLKLHQHKQRHARRMAKSAEDLGVPTPEHCEKVLKAPMPTEPESQKRWYDVGRLLKEWDISRWVMFLHSLPKYGAPEDQLVAPFAARSLVGAIKKAYPSFTKTDLETAILIRVILRAWPTFTKKLFTKTTFVEHNRKTLNKKIRPELSSWSSTVGKVFNINISVGKDIHARQTTEPE